jgi:hypothetical protein
MLTAAGRPALDRKFSTIPTPGRDRQPTLGASAGTSQRGLEMTMGYAE